MRRLALPVLLICAAPAAAQSTTAILCEHTALRAPLPAEAFNVDLAGATVERRDAQAAARVPARVSEQSIEWQSGSTLYTLDRASSMLIRVVLGEYATAWRCQPQSR
jgi:hypothetical protein